jgi:hypothetical protein
LDGGSTQRKAATYTGQNKNKINTDRYEYLCLKGFEIALPVFKQAKIFCDLDRTVSVIRNVM